MQPALPASNFARRVGALRAALDGRTMVLSHSTNIRWLTGFGGSLAWVVLDGDRLVLITDGRYGERAAADLAANGLDEALGVELEVRTKRPELTDTMVAAAAAAGGVVVAEADHLSHAAWSSLAERLDLEPSGGLVEQLRRSKDAGELARMTRAAQVADATLAAAVPMLAERPTEADVRDELEYRMRRNGADGPSYDTIVASGPQLAARPHHQTSRRTIVEGDTVIIDVGALVDDYHSDMTRTYVVGDVDARQQQIYDLVLQAQLAGLNAIRPGVPTAEVDEACRAVFRDAGYADWFIHGTGHGVGLDIHEEPFAAATSTAVLVEGDVVTVEPGLYRDGFGGVRIEDLVSVTATGCATLTTLPKDSPCLRSPPMT
ncbi:MAG TPA: aminopeptidase P family protein [Desertimonas sp.]|nr:aminopeptidase P family protein [Desertimonas sp.]